MSIYATWLILEGEDHDVEHCDAYFEESEGCWEFTGRACTCGAWKMQPIVYEGSHHLPSDADRRGGGIEVAGIPDHIERDDRPELPDGTLKDWLRIGVWSVPSITEYEGKPYVAGGDSTVVLNRPMVQELRDTLTAWLDRKSDPDVRCDCWIEDDKPGEHYPGCAYFAASRGTQGSWE